MLSRVQKKVRTDTEMRGMLHTPVMVNEVVELLGVARGKIFLDCTLGTGGHAEAILRGSAPDGRVIGVERDEDALNIAIERLAEFKDRFIGVYGNYANSKQILHKLKVNEVDGVVLDLGVSSYQLENPERGFSFTKEGPLDMRMDRNSSLTAEEIINHWNGDALEEIIRDYGEERYARRIARKIVEYRRKCRITTTSELRDVIVSAIPGKVRRSGGIHPATRTFQALRIAVNSEIENLEGFFSIARGILKKGGRIVVISFHSLEDRIVKTTFRKWKGEGVFNILTPHVMVPSSTEIASNPRARSAKMRAGEKII